MIKGFLKVIRENKNALKIAVLVGLGLFLIIFSSAVSDGKTKEEKREITLEEYKEGLEAELASLCADVSGVGKCRVFITFERGAQDTYKGSYVIETKPPKVAGVTVICRGGANDSVRAELTDMICALFGVGSNRVAILKLNS